MIAATNQPARKPSRSDADSSLRVDPIPSALSLSPAGRMSATLYRPYDRFRCRTRDENQVMFSRERQSTPLTESQESSDRPRASSAPDVEPVLRRVSQRAAKHRRPARQRVALT